MKCNFFYALIFSIIFFSCSNDDSVSQQTSESNFYALTVGNSWVYKNYKYDTNTQTYENTGVIDSISIISTEEIFGNTYFKFRRLTTGNEDGITLCNQNGEHFEYLREFKGNLEKSDGTVKFTNNDYSERLLNDFNWGDVFEKLIEGETNMTVEAGSFTCINSERYAINENDEQQLPGLDRFYYADGYGLIYDTSSFVSNEIPTIIRRLYSYEIQ